MSGFGGFGSGSGGFGSNTSTGGGLFGSGGSGGSGFGNTTNNNTANAGFGGFGNSNSNSSAGGGGLFGSNNNNNTSTTGGAFGSSFGNNASNASAGGLFGGANRTGGFGTNTSSSGGLFGGGSNTATSGGFGSGGGAFGSNNTNNTSTFGSSTGGGLFGATNNSTSNTGGFGGSTTGGGLFGSNNTASNTGTAFGSNSAGGFGGGTTSGFGSNNASATPAQGTPASFQPFIEKDTTGQNQCFNAISCVNPYNNSSFEELRMQDYTLGKKFGNQNGQAGAFGQSTGFGSGSGFGSQNTTAPTNNAFGSSTGGGLFGSASAQPAATTGGFGSNNSGGAFGSNNNSSSNLFGNKAGGLFGSNNTATSAQSTGGLFGTSGANTGFGSNNNATGGGLFGSNNNNSQSKPGLFGASTGGFGSTNNNTAGTGGGLFGSQNTNTNNTTNAFGQNNSNNQQSGGLFGGSFGQQNNQQQQPGSTGGGSFGSSFGNNQNSQQAGGGLFGAKPAASTGGGLFGGQNTQQQSNAGSNLFGGLGNNQNNNQQSGGLFGAKPAASGGGLFGNAQSNPQQGGGLFGSQNNTNNNAGGGLFGGSNNQQQKPSLFGNSQTNTNSGGGLFGGMNQNNNQQSNSGGSLFGGSNANNQSTFGSSLLQSNQQNQQPQSLTTSVLAPHPYGNVELFAGLGTPNQSTGPLATPLSSSQKNRKPAPLPQWKVNPAASSRLLTTPQNGRSTYQLRYSQYGTPGSAYGSPSVYGGFGGTPSSRLGKSLSTSNLRSPSESVLSPDAFSPSRSFRGGGSIKKLHINRSLRTDLFGESDNLRSSPLKKNVSFDSSEQAQVGGPVNGDNSQALTVVSDDATPSAAELGFLRSSSRRSNGTQAAQSSAPKEHIEVRGNELARVPENEDEPGPTAEPKQPIAPDHSDKVPGEYYMIPTKNEILKMSRQQRKSIQHFIVGRTNVGQVDFSEANLDGVSLDDICGNIVKLTVRSVSVYDDPVNKPAVGKGLNVPSRVSLENSWPRAKGGALPVYESKGKRYEKHVSRLNKMPGTKFVEYIGEKGIWSFDVPHFSTYQLTYEEDEMDEPSNTFGSSILSSVPDSPTPARSNGFKHNDSRGLSNSGSSSDARVDDTFEFRSGRNVPGAFDEDDFIPEELLGSHMASSANGTSGPSAAPTAAPELEMSESSPQMFHSSGPPMGSDGAMDVPSEGPRFSPTGAASVVPKSILKSTQRAFAHSSPSSQAQPGGWAERLQATLSPKKQDRNVLRQTQGSVRLEQGTSAGDEHADTFGTSLDIMKSLFGGSEKKISSDSKGFKIPEPKRPKTLASGDEEFIPSWADYEFHETANVPIHAHEDLASAARRRVCASQYHTPQGLFCAPKDLLAVQRKYEEITIIDDVPMARFPKECDASVLEDLTTAADAMLAALREGIDPRPLREEKQVWELATLLFAGFDAQADDSGDVPERKEKLMELWARIAESLADGQVKSAGTPEERAIAYLTGRKSHDASQALVEGRDFRLAIMIAQIGTDKTMRDDVQYAIDQWRQTNTFSEMTPRIRALYEFLAGQTCSSEATFAPGQENRMERINFSTAFHLNWRQSFGLKLWYGTLPEESISRAITSFMEDLQEEPEQAHPIPWFIEEQRDMQGWKDPAPTKRTDLLFGLLQIFAASRGAKNVVDDDLYHSICDRYSSLISPESTIGTPVDTRMTFQLYFILRGLGIMDFATNIRDDEADRIALDFTFQLSPSPAHLVDAVFAALHLRHAPHRARTVQSLLATHADTLGESAAASPVFATLIADLRIPEPWLWSAKAAHARSHSRPAEEMRYLLRARQPHAAHNLLQTVVGPAAVLDEDVAALRVALADLRAHGAAELAAWPRAGAPYGLYCDLVDARPGADKAAIAAQLLGSLPRADAPGLVLAERASVLEMREVASRMAAAAERAGVTDGDVERVEGLRRAFYRRMGSVGA